MLTGLEGYRNPRKVGGSSYNLGAISDESVAGDCHLAVQWWKLDKLLLKDSALDMLSISLKYTTAVFIVYYI